MKNINKLAITWIVVSYCYLYFSYKIQLFLTNKLSYNNFDVFGYGFSIIKHFLAPFIGILIMGLLIGILTVNIKSLTKMEYNTIIGFAIYLVLRYPFYLLLGKYMNYIYPNWMLRTVVDTPMYFGCLIISMFIVCAVHDKRNDLKMINQRKPKGENSF